MPYKGHVSLCKCITDPFRFLVPLRVHPTKHGNTHVPRGGIPRCRTSATICNDSLFGIPCGTHPRGNPPRYPCRVGIFGGHLARQQLAWEPLKYKIRRTVKGEQGLWAQRGSHRFSGNQGNSMSNYKDSLMGNLHPRVAGSQGGALIA